MPAVLEEEEQATPAPAAAPAAYIEYRDLPPVTVRRPAWPLPPRMPLEERIALVPLEIQEILVERGRALERREQAQAAYEAARRQLAEIESRALWETDERARQFDQMRQQMMEQQRRPDIRFGNWAACCAPERSEMEWAALIAAPTAR